MSREDKTVSRENLHQSKDLARKPAQNRTDSTDSDKNKRRKCSKRPKKLIFRAPRWAPKMCTWNVGLNASHTLQHGHYKRIHPGMDIGLSIRKSAYKSTCCLLSKGGFFVRYPQIGGKSNENPKRTKDLKEIVSKLYDNARLL